ncbi:PhoX family phosphatase [Candidatus Thalassolituus haligoni]|uniref:PhoX family protein n=1 Tax=Candidatus Thalassolituus haligoni TaxID=3100113 RepID=UPI0035193A02
MEFKKNKLLQALLMAALATGLAACGSDGDDGKDGVAGADGDKGDPGTPGTDGTPAAGTGKLTFTGVPAPATDAQKRAILVSEAVIDGESFGGQYHEFARSGDEITGVTFGQLVDDMGTALTEEDSSLRITDANEHTSLLPVNGRLFSVSQMETRPGAMFLFELDQDETTGALSPISLTQLDQKGVDGGWVHCAASVTPWNTHLASEEYEPDARSLPTATEAAADSYPATQLDYYVSGDLSWNPYYYGWNTEIEVSTDATDATSTPTVDMTKHYAMGRVAIELAYVMPDSKTAYITDDGSNVGFFMFVADTAGDLSAGNLYAAKWNQVSATGAGEATLDWISLGHADNATVSAYVHGTDTTDPLLFTDIFATSEVQTDGTCANAAHTKIAANGSTECLAVKTGMEVAASRLETRRYAALMGATTEFSKEEGVTYDSKRNKLYVAMSRVYNSMQADASAPVDHIQLNKNRCGAVYELDLLVDSTIGSNYVAKTMKGLVVGRPTKASNGVEGVNVEAQLAGFEDENSCHINGISEPDNVTYMSGYDYLIIGEDTGNHQNDVIWAYDFASQDLIRIQTTPYGSETTSPYWYPNINGFAYLMSVVQHPYGESDQEEDTTGDAHRAYTGYIGPFPAIAE